MQKSKPGLRTAGIGDETEGDLLFYHGVVREGHSEGNILQRSERSNKGSTQISGWGKSIPRGGKACKVLELMLSTAEAQRSLE